MVNYMLKSCLATISFSFLFLVLCFKINIHYISYFKHAGADAVSYMEVSGIKKNHVLCVDIYCCGLLSTRKSDCTGLPASMLRNPEGPQQRGQSHIKMKGNMSLISWYNKGNFRFLSNAYSPIKQGIILLYSFTRVNA